MATPTCKSHLFLYHHLFALSQLASDAANVVAMTDDEKARLKELLKDIDDDSFLDDMSLIVSIVM